MGVGNRSQINWHFSKFLAEGGEKKRKNQSAPWLKLTPTYPFLTPPCTPAKKDVL